MQHDAWFFVGFFFLVFLVWIATGGPTHPISFTGPTLALPGALGGGTYLSLPRATFGTKPVGGSGGTSSSGFSSSGEQDVPEAKTLEGVSFGAPSPYRGSISLSHYVSGAGLKSTQEYVQLSLSRNAPAPVTISGWTLFSEATKAGAVIPYGTEVPQSGVVNRQNPIALSPGDRVLIITGRSPIGVSFRENKCIGYLGSFQAFSPAFPNSCPLPENDLKSFYGSDYVRDVDCIEYVDDIPRCKVITRPPEDLSDACVRFIDTYLHYNGCVAAHQNDDDFKGDTWRIYLGRVSTLWRTKHEVVKLLDQEGKTVDAFAY